MGGVTFVGLRLAAWLAGKIRPSAASYRRARALQAEIARILRPRNALSLDDLGRTPYAPGQDYHGALASGREALVRIPAGQQDSLTPAGSSPSIEIEAPHAPRLMVRRRGWLDWIFAPHQPISLEGYVVSSLDPARAKQALAPGQNLVFAIRGAFETYRVENLLLWDGKLRARVRGSIEPARLQALLRHLDWIIATFEPVPVAVKVLGGERRALLGLAGSPRCSYCHADVTGHEPDLVACGLCHTILHDGCWRELGRCPVLGCVGREPERGRAAERG